MAKSSVHYLLVTLQRRGYVLRSERSGRYLFGAKLFDLANFALCALGLRQQTASHLAALQMRTGLTVHLGILERDEVIVAAKFESSFSTRVATWPGKRMDVHCTGLGKALLAHMPHSARESIIREHGLARHNENTISNPQRLKEHLDGVVRAGYALDDEEDELGLRCIGVPVFGEGARPVAAISLAGTVNEITPDNMKQLLGEIKLTAAAMNRTLAAA